MESKFEQKEIDFNVCNLSREWRSIPSPKLFGIWFPKHGSLKKFRLGKYFYSIGGEDKWITHYNNALVITCLKKWSKGKQFIGTHNWEAWDE